MEKPYLEPSKTLTYSSYLKVPELLTLQETESDEHDETLFIIIHQVYELWFKQMLHELDFLQIRFEENDIPRALHTLNRLLTILKTVVSQIDILETMTPLEFNSFRDRLGSSSGFQSYQFRELEFILGYKRSALLNHHPEGSPGRQRLEERFASTSIWDSFLLLLQQNGYNVPTELLTRDPKLGLEASPAVQSILIDIYRNKPQLASVCERLLDFDEGMQEWRYRHIKMVERTLGFKPGTGGSSGVSYLQTTLKSFFPDLWAIRSQL